MLPMPVPEAEPSSHKLTYEDYCHIPVDGLRHEILDGVHVVSPAPLDRHQQVCLNLTFLLESFLRRTRLGKLREAPSDVRLMVHDVVQPDHYVVLAKNLRGFDRRGFEGPPDLVVEVTSPGGEARDLHDKLARYEVAGVREYWVVDPQLSRVEVYRRQPGGTESGATARFARPVLLELSRGDRLETPLFPGFEADLAEVFDPGLAAAEEPLTMRTQGL